MVNFIDSNKQFNREVKVTNSVVLENKRSRFHTFSLYIKIFKTFLLSHHPECENFKGHTIKIGKNKLCIGCFIGYPSAIIGIFVIFYLNLINILSSQFFLMFGLFLMSSFILSPLHLTKIKSIKIIQKGLIGIGSSFLFWWVWILPNLFVINFLIFIIVFGILLSILNLYHAYGFYKTCKKCEYSLDWDNCPGFKDLRESLKENGLPSIFLKR